MTTRARAFYLLKNRINPILSDFLNPILSDFLKSDSTALICTFLWGGKYNGATEQLRNLHTVPSAKMVDEGDLQFEEKKNLFQVSPQDHPSQKEHKWELV